jgi:hypothetical protein
MTVDELLEEFSRFENVMLESSHDLQELEGTGEIPDIFEGGIVDWNELEKNFHAFCILCIFALFTFFAFLAFFVL